MWYWSKADSGSTTPPSPPHHDHTIMSTYKVRRLCALVALAANDGRTSWRTPCLSWLQIASRRTASCAGVSWCLLTPARLLLPCPSPPWHRHTHTYTYIFPTSSTYSPHTHTHCPHHSRYSPHWPSDYSLQQHLLLACTFVEIPTCFLVCAGMFAIFRKVEDGRKEGKSVESSYWCLVHLAGNAYNCEALNDKTFDIKLFSLWFAHINPDLHTPT